MVISRDYESNFPLIAGYNNGLPFVSEEVPTEFRPAWIAHEIIKFEELRNKEGGWSENCCVISLLREVDYVPKHTPENYRSLRRDYFRNLISYLESKSKSNSLEGLEKYLQSAKLARDFLEVIIERDQLGEDITKTLEIDIPLDEHSDI